MIVWDGHGDDLLFVVVKNWTTSVFPVSIRFIFTKEEERTFSRTSIITAEQGEEKCLLTGLVGKSLLPILKCSVSSL